MMFAVGIALFALAILVSVAMHECGHMWVARATGMKVRRYFVGFGPTLWSTRRPNKLGYTEYGVKAVPLGGYIRMIGMFPPRPGDAPGTVRASTAQRARIVLLAADGVGNQVIADTVGETACIFLGGLYRAEQVIADRILRLANGKLPWPYIDPEKAREAITDRTRAILAVHYGGHPCDMDVLQAICDEHDLLLIEDAAHAMPATYKGRLIGSGSNPVAFSFYATKNLTTAEGGMLTGSPDLIETGVVTSLHGMDRDAWKRNSKAGSWRYDIVTPGFKYNMTDIQAAIGLHQLRKLKTMYARRREIVELYNAAFAPLGVFDLPVEREGCLSAWHLYPIRLKDGALKISRDEFIEELRARNIGTSVHFIPIHTFTYYRDKYGFEPGDFPIALRESERVLTIPMHPGLGDGDVGDVVESLTEIVKLSRV